MGMLERLKDLKEKLDIKEFYSDDEDYIFADGEMCFEVRGWGYLTGYRGFSQKEALEIQKIRTDYAVESMNALPHLLKEIEVLKEGLKFSRTCLDECRNFIISRTDDEFCSGAINAKNGKENAEKALAEAERIEKGEVNK